MPETSRFVEKRTVDDIADLTNLVREGLQLGQGRVAMAPLLELVLPDLIPDYQFLVVPDAEMRGAEGHTDISRPIVRMSQTTYDELLEDDPRARFTAAHELGHLLMHSGSNIRYARSARRDRQVDPEWQANMFAACFLMPEEAFRQAHTIEEAMSRFGVGYKSAKWRAQELRHRFKRDPNKRRRSW